MKQYPFFGLGVFDRKDQQPSCFGFVISTKISKKAVVRNKIKRCLSESVRKLQKNMKKGYDVVFLVKSSIIKKGCFGIEKEVENAFKEAQLFI